MLHTHGSSHRKAARVRRHDPGDSGPDRRSRLRRLWIVLLITGAFMVAEVTGGVLSGSLALLADSGHMLTDVLALALSLTAIRLAMRPPSPERTFGYVRLEILAALANGAVLLGVSVWIAWEAWARLQTPREVDGPLMMGVAVLGLIVNLVGAGILKEDAGDNLNVRGAYLHVLGDLLGSVGAIGAGAVILLTGWTSADPLVSILIAGLILLGAWRLVREATEVLLEMAPRHVNMTAVFKELSAIPHLDDVHDLHVWTLTSGFVALSGHGVLSDPSQHQGVLDEIRERMSEHGIEHVTFQLEPRRLHQIDSGSPGAAGEGEVGHEWEVR